jgi:AcrR family transcriptional regulator
MRQRKSAVIRRNARGAREDGINTRAKLLAAAGVIFAQKGFDGASAKEIAASARTNAAAVNYHFGGIERLYQEVLVEAHNRLISLQQLQTVMADELTPEDKLHRLMEIIVGVFMGPAPESWAVRLIVREFLAPTPYVDILRRKAAEPKKALVFALVAQLLKLPEDHPAVARSFFNIAAPCTMLLLADRALIRKLLPSFDDSAPALVQHLVRFALGGIAAVAQAERGRS